MQRAYSSRKKDHDAHPRAVRMLLQKNIRAAFAGFDYRSSTFRLALWTHSGVVADISPGVLTFPSSGGSSCRRVGLALGLMEPGEPLCSATFQKEKGEKTNSEHLFQ